MKREFLDPTAPKGHREIEEIIEVTQKGYASIIKAKPKVRTGVEPGLVKGFTKADHIHSDGPTTAAEFAFTRFMFPATQLHFAKLLGVSEGTPVVKAEGTPVVKDNPALRAELKGKDIAELWDYAKGQGWEESEYNTYKNPGLLIEKIVQKSLETEAVI